MTEVKKDLDKRFEQAVKRASNTDKKFPPDLKLYFYAYYKRALGNYPKRRHHIDDIDGNALINGFKMNAVFQVKNIPIEEAKKRYIELVDKHILEEE